MTSGGIAILVIVVVFAAFMIIDKILAKKGKGPLQEDSSQDTVQ